ncbi:MAG: hypothetical protein UW52_C0066G0002 [Candidatus Gottesmanbacteria bacterium GW2011_GWA1_44_24b]|uniref:Uncharacterized protein n=1 Tax=Candidatus Gottesmanbacteria bacterium GW2011_GWA1_44_24b TaxID=1618437 RepID=A0A0G1LCK0_9BACT|nr:MAG: hypothetical protein UW52_C0066G0002 [Candidatus Gottesmanbacteria bacterium GW2011_GWA1_44_24b]
MLQKNWKAFLVLVGGEEESKKGKLGSKNYQSYNYSIIPLYAKKRGNRKQSLRNYRSLHRPSKHCKRRTHTSLKHRSPPNGNHERYAGSRCS